MDTTEKKYLTAQEAHAIAADWQNNAINDYIEQVLSRVRTAAKSGQNREIVNRPLGGVNSNGCYDALIFLGYKVNRNYSHNCISVEW